MITPEGNDVRGVVECTELSCRAQHVVMDEPGFDESAEGPDAMAAEMIYFIDTHVCQ